MPERTEKSWDLVENDWLITAYGRQLHYATGLFEGDWDGTWRSVKLACGRVVDWATIPGVFTRMGARRCGRCCDVRGLPRGKGSPKNDAACRDLLGLPHDPGVGAGAH